MEDNRHKYQVEGPLYSYDNFIGNDSGQTLAINEKEAIKNVTFNMKKNRGLSKDSKLEFHNPKVTRIW